MGAERPSQVSSQATSCSYLSSVTLISEGNAGVDGGVGGGAGGSGGGGGVRGGDGGEGGCTLTSKLKVFEKS